MLIEEIKDNRVLHYSDLNHYILQNETSIKYEMADDVYPCKYTYTETDEVIEEQTDDGYTEN